MVLGVSICLLAVHAAETPFFSASSRGSFRASISGGLSGLVGCLLPAQW